MGVEHDQALTDGHYGTVDVYPCIEVTQFDLDAWFRRQANNKDNLVFEEKVNLDGTPDPDVHVVPNVVGQWIRLIFTGHEVNDSGGFAELKVGVVR